MPNEQVDWTKLRRLYELESSKVSGPGTYRRDINDVLWTFNELQLALSPKDLEHYKNIVNYLLKKKQIMRVRTPGGEDRYITRVAEIVRLLGHNYEYWYRGRQSIDSIRWLIEDKKIPARNIAVEDFIKELLEMVRSEIANDNSTFNLRKAVEMVIEGVARYLEPKDWKKANFSEFQFHATREMILSQFKTDYEFKAQILTAGVGSGKTIGFSIGMLVSAVEGILSGEKDRRCHLFLYPRKALAQDQYNKLKDVVKNIGLQQLRVHLEHYSYYSSEKLTVKRGIPEVYGGPNPPPSLIVTTLETLNRRLQHPLVIEKISRYLKRVVLDEIHLVEGIPGCHVVRLLDRLRQACSSTELLWTGSSATVASPDLHAATVFGLDREAVRVIEPNIENLTTVGLVHHLFMRPTGRLSFLGSLVNSTSILIHNRRDGIWNRTRGKYPKTIGFADSLDLLGRWNSDLRENERTENTKSRPHPKERDRERWKPRQREIPYALRFHKPLEKRINVVRGENEAYEEVLSEFKGQEICDRCMKGERFALKTCDREEMRRLGRLVYRWPSKDKDNVKAFYIDNEIFEQDSVEVGTLDLCPYLRAGACFWFPQDDFESQEIVSGDNPRWEWRSVARSKIHSSKTRSEFELDDDLSDLVFTATIHEAYDLWSDKNISIDVVLASPSLEVGVDLPNVTESIMFKAIRNVASYRQKVGRIGREEGTNTINASLLSLRPVDLHYYRQPRKLISRAQLDPIPLKEYNDSILRCALYMAVWDYLAARCDLPEVVPIEGLQRGETEFTRRLRFSRDYLTKNRRAAAEYLSGISRGEHVPDNPMIQKVISQVSDELGILLTPISGTIDDERLLWISDMIVHSLSKYGVRVSPPKKSINLDRLRRGKDQYEYYRPSVNPILFGLSEEFQELDRLNDCGWADLERLKEIYDLIGAKLETMDTDSTPFVKESRECLELIHDRALGDIMKGLEGMRQSGENPIVIYFYEQFDKFKKEHPSWPYYLSYLIQGMPIFRLCRRDSSYVRPPNLFTNPYEETVTLYRKGQVEDNVTVGEALFGFIPGTWTFRLGKNSQKTLVGELDSYQGGVLSASLSEMRKQGNEFVRIKTDVPAPPGFPGDRLTIYMPTKLSIMGVYSKYVGLHRGRRTVIDGDECSGRAVEEVIEDEEPGESANGHLRIKIPKGFANRWVHIVADEGKRILVNELDEQHLVVEGETECRARDARRKIFHPLLKGMIDAVLWHDRLRVHDYVYSVSRSYSSKVVNNATLMFRDRQGDIAFGRSFVTEGVSFELNPESIKSTIDTITKEMLGCESRWAPSMLKALLASVSSIRLADGTPVSPFVINDLFGVIITSISSDLNVKTIVELPKVMDSLLEDESRFRDAATKFYKGKYLMGLDEEESWIRELSPQDRQDINRQVKALMGFASHVRGNIPDLQDNLEHWIIHTLLHTFAVAALSALQQLCGSKEEDIGCTVDLEAIEEGKYRIFLYDRTPYGNGSSDVLRRYLHILNIQRHKQTNQSRLLPSEDFLTLLEQELLQCPQFHTDMDALEKFNQEQNNECPVGLPELGYVSEYSDEVLRVSRDTWEQLGIRGRQDAWKLPIIALAPGGFAGLKGLEIDDVLRATTICWNGCPECVIYTGAMGGVGSQAFVDKAVLDEWFRISRAMVEEYKNVSVNDLVVGKSSVKIGRQSRVCLELPNRKIRSISLPFTIGFELDRGKVLPHARLIIRDDDVHDLRVFREGPEGSAHGIESLGFKRIMWYNLMSSAYLDVLGLVEEKRKEITLVFYDCRDVTFDDVGISPRMMEAIEHHRKKAGMQGEMRSLSDILIWLANRGFRITICVDGTRSEEEGVSDFLRKLAATGLDNIAIRIKGLHGLMHKKALITPLGIIQGSANLTFSGTGLNEEIINYVPFGAREYEEIKLNILDTFHGSEKWRGAS